MIFCAVRASRDPATRVRRYARRWTQVRHKDAGDGAPAFIPLMFKRGKVYQFDWSHEDVEIAGKPMRVGQCPDP
jgi:hypothetical protein